MTYHLHFPSLLWRKGWLEQVAGSGFRWWCGAVLRGRLLCLLRWSCLCVGGWAGRWWSPLGLGMGSRQAGPPGRDGGCPATRSALPACAAGRASACSACACSLSVSLHSSQQLVHFHAARPAVSAKAWPGSAGLSSVGTVLPAQSPALGEQTPHQCLQHCLPFSGLITQRGLFLLLNFGVESSAYSSRGPCAGDPCALRPCWRC